MNSKNKLPLPSCIIPYRKEYGNDLLRGQDITNRPWDLRKILTDLASQFLNPTLLDIGCGTCFRIIPLSESFEKIYAMDPSKEILEVALENKTRAHKNNITLVEGHAGKLPFDDGIMSITTSMMSVWDEQEMFRVLKPGGYAIVETAGNRDKENIKRLFGQDEKGWRGQRIDYEDGELQQLYHQQFSPYFHEITITDGSWTTRYTYDGIIALLSETSTVRNFDKEKDRKIIDEIALNCTTNNTIDSEQHRILIIAKKSL